MMTREREKGEREREREKERERKEREREISGEENRVNDRVSDNPIHWGGGGLLYPEAYNFHVIYSLLSCLINFKYIHLPSNMHSTTDSVFICLL